MSIFGLIKRHYFFFSFCFCVMFFTGLGQTYYVAQFLPYIMGEFSLGRTEVGMVYSLATLLASFNLSTVGKLFDQMSLFKFTIMACLGVLAAEGVLYLSTGTISLLIGFYLLRCFGQMTLAMCSSTSVSKLFGRHRGKALMLTGYGKTLAESLLPSFAILLIASVGWRESFLYSGLALCLLVIPFAFLIKNVNPNVPLYSEVAPIGNTKELSWSWPSVFKNKLVLFTMIINALIPFVLTGLFFSQSSVAEYINQSMSYMAATFASYGVVAALGVVLWGHLVDRFSAVNLWPFMSLPLLIGILILTFMDIQHYTGHIYMAFIGLSVGLSSLVRSSLWAEIFGVGNLGRIRGMDSSVLVLGTSLAPMLFGAILDYTNDFKMLLYFLISVIVTGMAVQVFIIKKIKGNQLVC